MGIPLGISKLLDAIANTRAVSAVFAAIRFFKPTLSAVSSYFRFYVIATLVVFCFAPITGISPLSAVPPASLLFVFFRQSSRWRLLTG